MFGLGASLMWVCNCTKILKMAADIPLVSRLTSRIIRVLGCNPGPMTLQGTNTYVIGTGKRRILLDTGDANVPQYLNNLSQVMKDEQATFEHIIVTHWHHDHVGGLSDVLKIFKSDCSVWKMKRTDVPDDSLPENIPYKYLHHQQEISIEGATLKVVHTPGHTTDHIVLTLKEENGLFSGDCILGEGTAVFEDLYDYMSSLHKIMDLKASIIYPGHGPVIMDPLPKIQYYIDHRNKREEQILNVLEKNTNTTMAEMDIVKAIYIDTPQHLHTAACFNVNHHLLKLCKENKVIKNGMYWEFNSSMKSSL